MFETDLKNQIDEVYLTELSDQAYQILSGGQQKKYSQLAISPCQLFQ